MDFVILQGNLKFMLLRYFNNSYLSFSKVNSSKRGKIRQNSDEFARFIDHSK